MLIQVTLRKSKSVYSVTICKDVSLQLQKQGNFIKLRYNKVDKQILVQTADELDKNAIRIQNCQQGGAIVLKQTYITERVAELANKELGVYTGYITPENYVIFTLTHKIR